MSWTPISKAYVFIGDKPGTAPRPVGVLVESDTGFRFAYARSWLADSSAFPLDPINLPLSMDEYAQRRCWGVFLDAGPDNWGQRVLLATRSQAPANQIEWLLAARGTGVGARSFSAARTNTKPAVPAPDFSAIAERMLEAEQLIANGQVDQIASLPAQVQKALIYSASMGGARPKFTVSSDGSEWICKLSRSDDTFNQPVAELACLNMAEACGITTPRRRLEHVGARDVLMIERFDRSPAGKRHYLSAHALLNPERAREGDPEGPMSYIRIADLINKVSMNPAVDRQELFTRMVLNVALGNTDDHLKNHGFLQITGDRYQLAPVFDVVPQPGQTALMALTIGERGREASLSNALSMHQRFGLSSERAQSIVERVLDITSQAVTFYTDAGASPLDAAILHAIAHEKGQQRSSGPSTHVVPGSAPRM